MTITLTLEQDRALKNAIQAGLVRSVDEFIDSAIEALPRHVSACLPWCCEDETTTASEQLLDWVKEGSELQL